MIEVADSCTVGIFIPDTVCFHCDSLTCESQLVESHVILYDKACRVGIRNLSIICFALCCQINHSNKTGTLGHHRIHSRFHLKIK